MTRQSLLAADQYVMEATRLFREAAELIARGATSMAEELVIGLDGERLRAHWNLVMSEPDRLGVPLPMGDSAAGRSRPKRPGAEIEREVFASDGWRCRWCSTPVIARRALRRMHLVFPVAFPRDATDRGRHGLILAASASLDHVLPLSRGGTNDRENLVTACWPCQFARNDWKLEELGLADPRERAPRPDDWDGVAWFCD